MSKRMVSHRLIKRTLRLAGIMFMGVSSALFYQSLFVASRSPHFFVTVYFNRFGEGLLELILFSAFIPFILFVVYDEIKEFTKWQR